MSSLDLLRDPVWQPLTWTLLHFLWQGLAVAAGAATVLCVWPVRGAHERYLICRSALIVMAACPFVTFMVVDAREPIAVAVVSHDAETAVSPPPALDPELKFVASEIPVSPADPVTQEHHPPLAPAAVAPSADVASASPVLEEAAMVPAPAPRETVLQRSIETIQPYALIVWIAGVMLLAMRLSLRTVGTITGRFFLAPHLYPLPRYSLRGGGEETMRQLLFRRS